MALTEAKLKDLTDKSFDELYEAHEAHWTAVAKKAYDFTKANVTNGNDPRPDDVAEALLPMLKVNDTLRAHQEEHRARGKRYLGWFVEYVIDRSLYKD